ncbi:MAG: hypothetical protein ACO3DT_02445 [Gammaproteobacteria bacterium]|jgi:hypothetical protein
MFLLVTGLIMLAIIIGLFWLKDRLASPLLARIAYSELIARLALLGGAFSVIGALLILADFVRHW